VQNKHRRILDLDNKHDLEIIFTDNINFGGWSGW